MTVTSFSSAQDLQTYAETTSLPLFKLQFPNLSLLQVAQLFTILQTQTSVQSRNKLRALFSWIDQPQTLEKLGASLNGASLISFLDYLIQHTVYRNRLPHLFIGLPSAIFIRSLPFLSNEHIQLLQHESVYEPLKYQLALLTAHEEILLTALNEEAEKLKQSIMRLQNHELIEGTLKLFEEQINVIHNRVLEEIEMLSKALQIAWHTDRTDLIDRLSTIKEHFHHLLTHQIGHGFDKEMLATGLYLELKNSFSSLFHDAGLQNQDSALEGLTKLSIWHLSDYWKLGLLPSIKAEEELDLPDDKFSEEERLVYKSQLFQKIQHLLEKINLKTVSELKDAHIFSKERLTRYIASHPSF